MEPERNCYRLVAYVSETDINPPGCHLEMCTLSQRCALSRDNYCQVIDLAASDSSKVTLAVVFLETVTYYKFHQLFCSMQASLNFFSVNLTSGVPRWRRKRITLHESDLAVPLDAASWEVKQNWSINPNWSINLSPILTASSDH